jgi:hypothetical protein
LSFAILIFVGLAILTASIVYKNSRPSQTKSQSHPNFTFTFHPTDSINGVLWLTNDFLMVTNFGSLTKCSGCLTLPLQPQESNTSLIFSVFSSIFAEDAEIAVSFPTNFGVMPEHGWNQFFQQDFTVRSNATNMSQTWGLSMREPMFPNDGYMLPKLIITNTASLFPNSNNIIHEIGFSLSIKAKNLPVEALVFSIVFIPVKPEETNAKPFVASFPDESGHKGQIKIPWR